jgi:hypothetical protein
MAVRERVAERVLRVFPSHSGEERQLTTSTVERRKRNERGATLILTALMLPVIVLFAGLGMGGAVVRSASDETQRTADLSALAGAESVPTLGRPTVSGLPTVPSGISIPLPPEVQNPASASMYTAGHIYDVEYNASTSVDKQISASLGEGPTYQSLLGSLGSNWTDGCNVGEAQYASGRAKMSRSFGVGGLTPKCATTANSFPNANNRIYVRPEFESTGEYRLYTCLVSATDCASLLGMGATNTLTAIGTKLATDLGLTPTSGCMVNPTGANCAFNASKFGSTFGVSGSVGSSVQQAVLDQLGSVTGLNTGQLGSAQASLDTLGQLLFGHVVNPVCNTPLGITGQSVCTGGADLASLLPSTMTPRVRSIVAHCIDIPVVPSLANARCGDFSFTSQSLARRTFKNAIVVPTLPANFGVTASTDLSGCLQGKGLLPGVMGSLNFVLNNNITVLNPLLQTAVGLQTAKDPSCLNASVDGSADASGNINLNPMLAEAQGPLVDAAVAMNNKLNDATNFVLAQSLNAQDGKSRTVADCHTAPPAPWCVDMGGQQIQDVRDLYNPPTGDQAPTMQDILSRAASTHEPIMIVSLGKYVKVPLPSPVATVAGTISALTYWIPALDFVPATVESFNPNTPAASTFKVVNQASGPKGLYRGVLLDPKAAPALCTVNNDPYGRCADQPGATVMLP